MNLNPSEIRYSQNSISSDFTHHPGDLDDMISDLRSGRLSVHSIPTIEVVLKDYCYYVLSGNRRLYCFKAASLTSVPVTLRQLSDPNVKATFDKRFTTKNNGLSIHLRQQVSNDDDDEVYGYDYDD